MKNFSELRQKAGMSIEDIATFSRKSSRTIYRWEKGTVDADPLVVRHLEDMIASQHVNPDPAFSFIDLFAGIGGIRKGFESVGGQCVFTSEWDKFSRQTYRANFRDDHEIAGDISQFDEKDIPAHDVLLAGFPCQPFSLAGISKKNSLGREHGFKCKTQGTLFFDVARIIEHHRPKAFLLENVKHLHRHDGGKTFEVIMKTLKEELGYTVDYVVVDGRGYVPQHRERIYIAGFLEDTGFRFSNFSFRKPDEGPILSSILHNDTEPPEEPYTVVDKTTGKTVVNDKYTLSEKLWKYLQSYAEKHRKKGNGFGFGLVGPEDTSRTLSARYHKDGSEILVRQEGKRPRRLTPRECARLMGFDESRTPEFRIPVSDTQAYRQFGNSVVVPVIKDVAGMMLPHIECQLSNRKTVNNRIAV